MLRGRNQRVDEVVGTPLGRQEASVEGPRSLELTRRNHLVRRAVFVEIPHWRRQVSSLFHGFLFGPCFDAN